MLTVNLKENVLIRVTKWITSRAQYEFKIDDSLFFTADIASEEGQGRQDRNTWHFYGRNLHQESLCSAGDGKQSPLDLTPTCLIQSASFCWVPLFLTSSCPEITFQSKLEVMEGEDVSVKPWRSVKKWSWSLLILNFGTRWGVWSAARPGWHSPERNTWRYALNWKLGGLSVMSGALAVEISIVYRRSSDH